MIKKGGAFAEMDRSFEHCKVQKKMCALALVGSPCRVHGVVLGRDKYSRIDVPS